MSALRMTERHTAANEQRQYIGVQKEGKGEKKGLDLYRSFHSIPRCIFLYFTYSLLTHRTIFEHEVGWGWDNKKEGSVTKRCIVMNKEDTEKEKASAYQE